MPPDGYPALQYLQSVRVRTFSSRPSGAEGPSPGPRMHAIAYPGLETSSAAMNHQFAPRSLLADIRYGCERRQSCARGRWRRFRPRTPVAPWSSKTPHTIRYTQSLRRPRRQWGTRVLEVWKRQPGARYTLRINRLASAAPEIDRPLLAEAGFILEIGMNLLLGMRCGDGVDLLDDDLLEEFLDLGVGLLMLGPGHQAAGIEAMQQVIDRLPAQAHAEFLLQDAVQVLAAEGADAILGGGPGLEAVTEPRHIRRGQAGRASGVGPLLEGRQAPLVVAVDPGLNGAARASQGPGDRGGGVALLGQHDGLMTQYSTCRSLSPRVRSFPG